MKSNNLELALRRFEISGENDKVSYENHYYNGFSGAESSAAYANHLEATYNNYFLNLRSQIDVLVLQNVETALKFLQAKIILFNEIKNDFELISTLEFWKSNKEQLNREMQQESIEFSMLRKIKNQRDTVDFIIEMIQTQNYFINKAITELTEIFNIYNPPSLQPTITENQIDKNKWENTLLKEPDILTTFDLARIFNKDKRTINRWVKEGVIVPIDKKKRPQQFQKDDVKKYYLKLSKL